MKHTILILITIFSVLGMALFMPVQGSSQGEVPASLPDLTISTTYPSQVVERGESFSLMLKLSAAGEDQTVQMAMDEIPASQAACWFQLLCL